MTESQTLYRLSDRQTAATGAPDDVLTSDLSSCRRHTLRPMLIFGRWLPVKGLLLDALPSNRLAEVAMTSISHQLGSASEWITWTAGLASAAATVGGYARQWPASYRRVACWVLMASGIVLASAASGWLVLEHVAPLSRRGSLLLSASAVGLALAVLGAVRAARTPVEPAVNMLRAIANAVNKNVDLLDKADGFDGTRFVDINVEQTVPGARRAKSLAKVLWRARNQLTIVTGGSGTGKTIMLRMVARRACRNAYAKRDPKRLVIYVDFTTIRASKIAPTADSIRACIQEAVAVGDTTLADYLATFLHAPQGRPKWMIIFDSIEESYTAITSSGRVSIFGEYHEAIRQFLNSAGPNFRAVIVTREANDTEDLATGAITLASLSARQRQRLSEQGQLEAGVRRHLLRRLLDDTALKEIAENPLLFGLLCDHLRATGRADLPASLYDIVDVSITTRLRSMSQPEVIEDIVSVAEEIAYLMTTEGDLGPAPNRAVLAAALRHRPEITQDPELGIQALIRCRICRLTGSEDFSFVHRIFQEHFRAGWLLRHWKEIDAHDLLTLSQWRESAVVGIRSGPDELRKDLIHGAIEVLMEQAAEAQGVLSSVAPLLALSDSEPLPTPTTFFIWPVEGLHVLQLLSAGITDKVDFPAELTQESDRLIISAFAGGMLLDKKRAIDVSCTASPEAARWIAERALASGVDLLQQAAARLLLVKPHTFAVLRPKAKGLATAAAVLDGEIVNNALIPSQEITSGSATLPGSIHNLARAAQITALGFGIFSIREIALSVQQLVTRIAHSHENLHYVHDAIPAVIWWALLLLASVVFLSAWTERRHPMGFVMKCSVLGLIIAEGLAAFVGVLTLMAAVVSLAELSLGAAIIDGIFAYLYTWPAAMLVFISVGPPPDKWDWLVPQAPISRIGMAAIPLPALRIRGETGSSQGIVAKAFRGIFNFILFIILIGSLAAAIVIPLPMVKQKQVDNVRAALLIGVLAFWIMWSYSRRRRSARRIVRSYIAGQSVAGMSVLESLDEASTQLATERLLKVLSEAAPGALRNSASSLADLARALDHVARMVPSGVRTPIPAAIWDVGPTFTVTDFREWVSKFDKRYPGRLVWLAGKHQGLIAKALDRAEMVTRDVHLEESPES